MQIELDDQLIEEIQRNLLDGETIESFIHHACIGVLNIRDDSQLVHLVEKRAKENIRISDNLGKFPSAIERVKAHRHIKECSLKQSHDWVMAHFEDKGRGKIIE